MSGIVLTLLPVALALVMFIISPDYISTLFTTDIGRILVVIGIGLLLIGGLWMRHVTSLKF